MATQRTSRAALQYWQLRDPNWHLPYQATCSALDSLTSVGDLVVSSFAVDSSMVPNGLVVKISAGGYRKGDGTNSSYAGTSGFTVTDNATTYLWLTDAGTLASGSAWPTGINHVRLGIVVAASGNITSITNSQIIHESSGVGGTGSYLLLAGGTMTDGANIAVGTATGTQLATGVTQKLGFWGATPGIQPASANQAAIGSILTATLTDTTGGSASTTLAAISDTATKNAVASLAAQVNNTVTDLGALKTLLNQIRSDLVARGLLKGSA